MWAFSRIFNMDFRLVMNIRTRKPAKIVRFSLAFSFFFRVPKPPGPHAKRLRDGVSDSLRRSLMLHHMPFHLVLLHPVHSCRWGAWNLRWSVVCIRNTVSTYAVRVTAAIDGFAHSGRLFPPAHQRLFSMTQSGIIHGKYGCFVIRERTVRDFDNARIYKIHPTLETGEQVWRRYRWHCWIRQKMRS